MKLTVLHLDDGRVVVDITELIALLESDNVAPYLVDQLKAIAILSANDCL